MGVPSEEGDAVDTYVVVTLIGRIGLQILKGTTMKSLLKKKEDDGKRKKKKV